MKLALIVCALAPLSLSAGMQDGGARRPVPIVFQAECTLTPEIVDQVVLQLQSDETRDTARSILAEHELEHGWSSTPDGLDFIDAAHAVRCPALVLEKMAALHARDGRHWDAPYWEFAIALQRCGRLDQALSMLDAELPAKSESTEPMPDRFQSGHDSDLSEIAAKLCAREGRFERALEYAKKWIPTSGCGNCDTGEHYRIDCFREQMLAKLGRHEEAIAIVRRRIEDTWNTPGPAMISIWIDCELESRRCSDAESATTVIRSAGQGNAKFQKICDSGRRLWGLEHASREIQLKNLSELAGLDSDLALQLAFGYDNPVVGEHLDALEVVGGKLRDEDLVWYVLARTGNPILRPAFDRAEEKLGKKEIEMERERWDHAHARWVALSQAR